MMTVEKMSRVGRIAPMQRPRLEVVSDWAENRDARPVRGNGVLAGDLKHDLIALLPRLRRFARALTRSVPEADDLVQEACLRALSRSDQWDPSQPLDRWMFRITRNLWISEIRKRQVRLGEGQVPAEEATDLVSHATGEASVALTDLGAQIAALPEDLAAILLAVSVEGYSYSEAADLFAIPVGTVMSRIHRARKALAQKIDASEGAAR
ncbi:MAG: RNA polymerase sigma factor [Pseudomonadota bacterium]